MITIIISLVRNAVALARIELGHWLYNRKNKRIVAQHTLSLTQRLELVAAGKARTW